MGSVIIRMVTLNCLSIDTCAILTRLNNLLLLNKQLQLLQFDEIYACAPASAIKFLNRIVPCS